MNTDVILDDLHKRLAELSASAQAIQNTADNEGRAFTTAENEQTLKIQDEFKQVEASIAVREANAAMAAKLNQPQARITKPDTMSATPAPVTAATSSTARPALSITGGLPSGTTSASWGFRSIGDFAKAAIQTTTGRPDMRIVNAPSSYGSEGVAPDGGYLVPPEFRQNILKVMNGEDSLVSRCDQQQTSGNSFAVPRDTVSPWDTSSGVQVAWMGEGASFSQSKPVFSMFETKVHKIGALVALTDELIEDVGALTSWLNSKVPEKLTSALNDTILNGNGLGKPLGIMQSGSLVTVSKESGQAVDTVVAANIAKMFARMYPAGQQRAVWLVHSDVQAQLNTMTIGNQPAYLPPGGLSGSQYGTLYGRPVLPMEACAAIGDLGDIVLADLSQYLTVVKTGGLRADTSIHLYFDTGHQAMRFAMRIGGQPYWDAPTARKNGSSSLSAFVTLEAR